MGVVRLNDAGLLDGTFNGGLGQFLLQLPEYAMGAVVVGPTGRSYYAGSSPQFSQSPLDHLVVALEPDGSSMSTFGSNGQRRLDGGTSTDDGSLTLRFLGSDLLFAGYTTAGGKKNFSVARVDGQGVTGGFGASGTVSLSMSAGDDLVRSLLTTEAHIYVIGSVGGDTNIGIARYSLVGDLDTTFGVGGRLVISVPEGPVATRGAVMTPEGKILIAGSVTDGGVKKPFVARYVP